MESEGEQREAGYWTPPSGWRKEGELLHNNGVLIGRGCAQWSGDPGLKGPLDPLEAPQGKKKWFSAVLSHSVLSHPSSLEEVRDLHVIKITNEEGSGILRREFHTLKLYKNWMYLGVTFEKKK